jgi:hypothetical protein
VKLRDETRGAVFVIDQPFSDGFLVHGEIGWGNAIMPPTRSVSVCPVPEQEAAQACLILPQTPFTLTTGLAKCRKPISDGSLAHRHGQPELA